MSPRSPLEKLALSNDLREEWALVHTRVSRFLGLPSFLSFCGRQVLRMGFSARGDDLPDVLLNAFCENIQRSKVYQAALYWSGRGLYPEKFEGAIDLRLREMVRWFLPSEVLSVLLFIYFNRYLQRRCPPDTWNLLNPFLRRDLALGRRLGSSFDRIRPGRGMLVGGMRRVAQGYMLLTAPNEQTVKKLLNLQLREEGYADPDRERALCGYSHLTMAGYLSLNCGLGLGMTGAFTASRSFEESGNDKAPQARDDDLSWQATRLFLEELHQRKAAATLSRGEQLQPTEERETLDAFSESIRGSEDVFAWLNVEPSDFERITEHRILTSSG